MTIFPYEGLVEPESVDIDSERLARVVALFQNQQRSGLFPGGQLVLRRNGKLVLNGAIGIARGFRPNEAVRPMQVRQGLVDDPYGWSVALVQVGEVAAPDDGNLEGFEIAGRTHHDARAAGEGALVGPSDDVER